MTMMPQSLQCDQATGQVVQNERPWLILRCLPRSEKAECERLQSMGIEATHPRVKRRFKRRHRLGSKRPLQALERSWPLISGLIFIRTIGEETLADMALIHRCRTGRHSRVTGYVASVDRGGLLLPYRLPDSDLERLFAGAGAQGRSKGSGELTVNQKALIAVGPLQGSTLTIARIDDETQRARGEAELFGRAVTVETPLTWLAVVG